MQSRWTLSSTVTKHEEKLQELTGKADDQAKHISNQSGYQAVEEFVTKVEQYLTITGEKPVLELNRFIETWEKPADTGSERLTQLKRFRKNLFFARIMEEFSRIDQLHLPNTLMDSASYYNSLNLSPVVRAHQERLKRIPQKLTFDELANLEENEFRKFQDDLNRSSDLDSITTEFTERETAKLVNALASTV
jgi:hypothetical protein